MHHLWNCSNSGDHIWLTTCTNVEHDPFPTYTRRHTHTHIPKLLHFRNFFQPKHPSLIAVVWFSWYPEIAKHPTSGREILKNASNSKAIRRTEAFLIYEKNHNKTIEENGLSRPANYTNAQSMTTNIAQSMTTNIASKDQFFEHPIKSRH